MWGYTPREVQGWLKFAEKRRRAEIAEGINTVAWGARGDPKELKKFLKDLVKD